MEQTKEKAALTITTAAEAVTSIDIDIIAKKSDRYKWNFTIFTRDGIRENAKNISYPDRHEIESLDDFMTACQWDNVCAEFSDGERIDKTTGEIKHIKNYRDNKNFVRCDHIVLDCDNDDKRDLEKWDNPENWTSVEKLKEIFKGVTFYIVYSRNHMKEKKWNNGTIRAARPKFHIYLPLKKAITNADEVRQLKEAIIEKYPDVFDEGAKDAARFLFGVENPQGEFVEGEKFIDEVIEPTTINLLEHQSENHEGGKSTADNKADKQNENATKTKHGNDDPDYLATKLKRFAEIIPCQDLDDDEWVKYSGAFKLCGLPYDLWDKWNLTDPARYNAEENRKRWDSFNRVGARAADIGSLAKLAIKYGYSEKDFKREYYGSHKNKTQKSGDTAAPERKAIALPDWKDGENGKRVPVKKSWRNLKALLHEWEIRRNLLTKNIEGRLKGTKSIFPLDELRLNVTTLAEIYKLSNASDFISDAICVIANNNAYSPVCDFLNQCKSEWDGKDHIEELFSCLKLDEETDREFALLLFRRWLISCVKMAFNEGDIAAQGVFVLQGAQGIGKTRFLSRLVPNKDWFAVGQTLDPRNKDDVMRVNTYWICELGEFCETLRKERLNALKNFITMNKDVLRRPYGRETEEQPRRTVFIATVNETRFLQDETGDRRYWCIGVKHIDNEKSIDIRQLWGQVVHLAIDENEPHYLTLDEIKRLFNSNKRFEVQSPEARALLDKLDWDAPLDSWKHYTASELCKLTDFQAFSNVRMGKAIRKLAEEDERIGLPTNNHGKKYLLPPEKHRF